MTILNRFRSHDTSDNSFGGLFDRTDFKKASRISAWNGTAEIRTQIETFHDNFQLFP